MKVYISPSEQEHNAYAYGNYTEEQICHRIGDAVKAALDRNGILCRKAPLGQHMETNIIESNAYKPDVHLCIHTNAANGKARGTVVYVSTLDAKHLKYAQPVYDELYMQVQGTSYGVRTANFAEIRQTTGVCVYCECEFHDNPERAKWIVNNVDKIAEAIAAGLCRGAGLLYKAPAQEPSEAPTEADTAKARASKIMKGNGRDDYWQTPPTREQLAIILMRAGVI